MRIAYCTNVRLPSERAHGHQIAEVCRALDELGHAVSVFAPYRRNTISQSFHAYENLPSRISIHYGPSIDPIGSWWAPGVLGLWLLNALFRFFLRRSITLDQFDLIYTRTPALLSVLLRKNLPVVLELHQIPKRFIGQFLRNCQQCRLIVCLTRAMKDELVSLGLDAQRLIVEGDAVRLELFANAKPQSIPTHFDRPLIVYAGQLESMNLSKGIPELLQALRILVSRNIPFHACIAGGPQSSRLKFQHQAHDIASSVSFLGTLPHSNIPSLISAADILIYPAPKSDHPFYRRDTSPLKIFEYIATKKPTIIADLPPLRDVLTDDMTSFVPPGDPEALADAISDIISHPDLATSKAECAFDRVQEYTWRKRMERILRSISLC